MTLNHQLQRTLASLVLVGVMTILAHANQGEPLPAGPAIAHPAEGGLVFCNGVRLQDEIVVVNVRSLCGICDPASLRSGALVENYAICDAPGHRRWQRSDFDSFLAYDSSAPTIIYVHGNRMTPRDAKQQGLDVYRRLARYAGSSGPPIRFVIFSWPSEQAGRLLRDVRIKAARTGPTGCQLAWLVDQMPAETPISLVGFSFGARVITSGLHLLGGGSLGHLSLYERVHPDRPPVNAVLISATMHAHWLGDGQYHGLAMTQVNRLLSVNNCRDPAMRYYHLAFDGRPQALGLRGPTCISPAMRSKILNRDVSRYVSRHLLDQYLCVPELPGQIWEIAVSAVPVSEAQVAIAN
jgi:hypothetical protein